VARLYANENFPQPVVEVLRRLGHDVLTTHDAGRSGKAIPDSEVLRFAVKDGRAVVTINRRDFIRLHRQDSHHAGVVVCSNLLTSSCDIAPNACSIFNISPAVRTWCPCECEAVRCSGARLLWRSDPQIPHLLFES